MKNLINKFSLSIMLVMILAQMKMYAQPGVPAAPYCLPQYFAIPCNQPNPSNTPGNFINDFINSFNTGGGIVNITNNNSGCNTQVLAGFGQVNYIYHGCQHYLQTVPGAVITCNMQSGTGWAQGFAVFVDWNNDGTFTNGAPEKVIMTGVPAANTFVAGNFTVPAGQAAGVYRMRVRCIWATTGAGITPCGATTYGEVEDYNIYVNQAPAGVITATASASSPVCSGNPLTLTVQSSASPTTPLTYTWTGPNGYVANVQSPTVSATSNILMTGVYTVVVNPGACPATTTVAVTVNSTPTITSVTNSGPVCQGTPLSFSAVTGPANPVGGTAGYSWTGPGFSSSLQAPTIGSSATSNTGVYTLSVTNTFTNGGSCSSFSSTSAFVVPVAQVVVAPTTATICQNANFSVTANAPAVASSYSWSGPAFNAGTQNISLTNVSPLNSGNYSVTAYFTSPGTTLVCSSSAVSNLSVVPRNPVVTAASNNICQYTTGTLTANAVGAYAYSWTGPNNYFSTAQSNTITNAQPIDAGTYFVTAYFSIGTVTCTTNSSDQINVVPVNSITVNPPVSVCYPSNVALQASSQGAITYSWSGPASYTSIVANPVLYAPTTTATGVFTITTSYNNGILTCYNSNTVGVTVNPILTFTLPSFNRICYNTLYTVDGPAGATSYTWTSSSGYTSNSEDLSIPGIQPNQSGTYTLSLNLGPCITKAETKVEVLTPIQFTLTPNSRTICDGDSVRLVMGSTGGSQNYAYQWNPAVFIGSPTGSTAVGVPHGTTIYQVTGYDIACPQYSITHSFTVAVNQPPKPDLQLDKASGCQPLTIFFDGKTKQDAAITTYDFGGVYKMQADSFWYTLNEPGTYRLKISTKGKNGCYGMFDYPYPITVFPKPGSDVIFNPEVPTTSNNQVVFNPTHKYGPVVTYEWMFQGAAGASSYDTSSVVSPFRIYDEVGKYPVMLISTTDKGCKDTVFKILDIRDEMTVYIPNTFTPNNDNLNDIFSVKGIGLKMEGYSMEIFDRWGSLMYSTRDILKGWDGTAKGQPAQNGVYIYKIKIIGANGEGKKEYIGHVTLLK
ncbi:MAG: hypothetical protein K0S32_2710 [Bacteroidetes bacterium]|jgi:gliding motility-associated-like protein|nr:hypothetical protein [Bacteroidota bacterium]